MAEQTDEELQEFWHHRNEAENKQLDELSKRFPSLNTEELLEVLDNGELGDEEECGFCAAFPNCNADCEFCRA